MNGWSRRVDRDAVLERIGHLIESLDIGGPASCGDFEYIARRQGRELGSAGTKCGQRRGNRTDRHELCCETTGTVVTEIFRNQVIRCKRRDRLCRHGEPDNLRILSDRLGRFGPADSGQRKHAGCGKNSEESGAILASWRVFLIDHRTEKRGYDFSASCVRGRTKSGSASKRKCHTAARSASSLGTATPFMVRVHLWPVD